jgi:Fe(3+) dicitrate transport protein
MHPLYNCCVDCADALLPRRSRSCTLFRLLFIFSLICLQQHAAHAQHTSISGVVLDAASGNALTGANIKLEGNPVGTASAADGSFTLAGVPFGEYTLQISHVGYTSETISIILQSPEHSPLVVRLSSRPIEMSELLVERDMLVGRENGISLIPGSAHVINLATLKHHSYNDINRALRDVPGLNIQEEDGFGLRPNIGMRGTVVERSQKISLMEDGVLIAPAPYAAPAAYYFPTVGRMEGIEVRKGSSQIKYGPYTTGGALNLISTRIPNSFDARVNLSAGDHRTRSIHASAGDSYGNLAFVAETYQAASDGFKQLDNNGPTGFDKKDYMAKLRFNTDSDASVYQDVVLKLSQTDELSDETYLGLTDSDFERTPYRRYAASQRDQMKTAHSQYQLRHFIRPADFIDITTTAYRNNFKRNWYKLDKVLAEADGKTASIAAVLDDPERYSTEYNILTGAIDRGHNALNVKANNREYYAQGIQSIVGMQWLQQKLRHEIELGLRYHRDQEDRFQWEDAYSMSNGLMQLHSAGTPGTESNRINQATALAAFLQYRLTTGRLAITPGLRYEDIRLEQRDYGKADPGRGGAALKQSVNTVSAFIPGVGINYSFSQTLNAFLGVHKGFSPPGFKEGARPEQSISYEIGARYHRQATNVQAVVFYNDYSNLLGVDLAAGGGMGTGDLFNGGAAEVKGLELTARHYLLIAPGPRHIAIPLRLSYTYTDAQFGSDFRSDFSDWGEVYHGYELPYIARHQLCAGAGIELGQWSLDIGARYVGAMRTRAGSGTVLGRYSTDAQLVLDGVADYRLTTSVRLFFAVRNITDQVHIVARRPAGARPGIPRTMLIGLQTNI